jgi:hypothetical protein
MAVLESKQKIQLCKIVRSVLSPMLANVVPDDLDKLLESRAMRFTRYADDFTICVKSSTSGLATCLHCEN